MIDLQIGDSRKLIHGLTDKSVDCVMTSPPIDISITNTIYSGMSNEIILAYLAGFVDGEGSLMIRKNNYRITNPKYGDCKNPQYSPRVGVKNTCEEPLVLLKETFGGHLQLNKKIYPSVSGFKSNKPLYVYNAEHNIAYSIVKTLLPYLIVKKKQAETLLKLRDSKKDATKNRDKTDKGFHGKAYRQESISDFEELYQEVKRLNGSGKVD